MENKVIVYNSHIEVLNYKNCNNLRKLLSYFSIWDKRPNGSNYISMEAYVIKNEKLYLHSGININYLMEYYSNHNLEYQLNGNPYSQLNANMVTQPRNELQKETINFLTRENNILSFVCLKPGSGKTFCAINSIISMKMIPLIIVDMKLLSNQWIKSFTDFTNLLEDEICLIQGTSTIKKLFTLKKKKSKVFIINHKTITSFINVMNKTNEDGWNILSELFTKLGIGIKVFDECHENFKNMIHIDLFTNIKHTFYLTATPFRSDANENKMYKKLFGNIDLYGYHESRYEKYLYYININWNTNPTQIEEIKMSTIRGFNLISYSDYLYKKHLPEFGDILLKTLKIFLDLKSDSKIAIVFSCNNMIESMKKFLTISLDEKHTVGIFSTLIANDQLRLKELDNQIILTTISGFRKGADKEGLNVLINTVPVSSGTVIEQISGRTRYNKNYKCYFVQLTDNGFKQCKAHKVKRDKIMENIAKKTFEMEF